ncbi:MAG: HAMP domain-containing protein, partial [Alphaproteobacteria bacterium]
MMAAFLGIFFITYGPAAIVIFTTIEASMRDAQVRTLDQIAAQKRQKLSAMFQESERNLRAWAGLEVMNDIFALDVDKRIVGTLTRLKQQYDLPGELFVFDQTGRIVAATRSTPPTASLPARWKVGEGDRGFIDKHADPLSGDGAGNGKSHQTSAGPAPPEIVALVHRIHARFGDRQPIGLMVMTIPWSAISGALQRGTAPVVLLDQAKKRPLYLPPFLDGNGDSIASLLSDQRQPILNGVRFITGHADGGEGMPARWRIIALQNTQQANAPIRSVAWRLALLGLVLLAPISIGIHWLARRLTGPLLSLEETVGAMRRHQDLSLRARLSGEDEIGALAR